MDYVLHHLVLHHQFCFHLWALMSFMTYKQACIWLVSWMRVIYICCQGSSETLASVEMNSFPVWNYKSHQNGLLQKESQSSLTTHSHINYGSSRYHSYSTHDIMAAYKLCKFWIQRRLHHNFSKNWENRKVTETVPKER